MTDHVETLLDEGRKLTPEERAMLIERLWDTLPPETSAKGSATRSCPRSKRASRASCATPRAIQ